MMLEMMRGVPPFQAQVQARPRRHHWQAQAGFQEEIMLEMMR
jgi:hypothetical protein